MSVIVLVLCEVCVSGVCLCLQDVVHAPPRPLRIKPGCKGPAVNRDLKPGRLPKSASDGRLELMGSADRAFTVPQRPVRSLPRDHLRLPPPPVQTITDYPNQFAKFDESPPSRPAPEPASPQTRSHNSRPAWTQSSPSERENGLEDQNWYVGAVSRVDAEHALHLVNREGAFLVRDCSKSTTYEPLVLAVFYDKRVFNIQIRFSDETSKYSLGTGLRTNDRFDSVTDIIRFHSIFPIVLIDGRKPSASANQRRQCVLMYPITKQDLTELLK
uniref:SH2 domain-containing protein n=1 Tax=Cyprinus carpio TaxID=7962 RepID=A0A8C1TWQ7_CYPCA